MGYLGGINIALLLLALDSLSPDVLSNMFNFFSTYASTLGDKMITLTPIAYHPELGFDSYVWSKTGKNRYDNLVVLTPTYPAINSMHSTTLGPLNFMKSEFKTIANTLNNYRQGSCVEVK